MEEIKLTPEEVQKSISAAYDSVNLINSLKLKESLTEEETDCIKRNKEHIKIMLDRDWFVGGLTTQQKTELKAVNV
jgi:hypothetical protein